eukprot:m.985408 g.985408  ORF g.985408 m.985408 type:complete len:115 (+) comp23982_c2_seq18:59-403(+)
MKENRIYMYEKRCSYPDEKLSLSGMSQIAPNLLLGGKNDAKKALESPGDIVAILNVSDKCFYFPKHDKIVFQHIPMCDYGTTPLTAELVRHLWNFSAILRIVGRSKYTYESLVY